MRLLLDIEADALKNPTKIWCIVAKNIDTGEVHSYDRENVKEGVEFLRSNGTCFIGHNLIGYDRGVIRDLFGFDIRSREVVDTLVLSHLLKFQIEDGHSLEAWGIRLGYPKGDYSDWSQFTPEMLEYCKRDVELNHKLYNYLWAKLNRPEFEQAIKVEHEMAWICQGMHEDGFNFDKDSAKVLYNELTDRLRTLDDELLTAFPPKAIFLREITPRLTKYGTISRANLPRDWHDLTELADGCPFSLVKWEPFNPGSTKQIVDRLWDAGWSPTDKTKGHLECENSKEKERLEYFQRYGWKVNELNLSTVPDTAPKAAHRLVERLLLAGRHRTLEEWFEHYNESTGCIHAKFHTIGAWTGRMSHTSPNLGNVATAKSIKYRSDHLQQEAVSLGSRMRSLWTCDKENENSFLVGTDAVGIQLRIFAHYINDPVFTQALISGKSSEGTDAHSINANILVCSRETAKTFIYAFLLGAGDSKIAEILGVKPRQGREAKRSFIEAYPGLRTLRNKIVPGDARRGYFQTFDGRYIVCDSEHLMMAGYLQAGEMCVIKHACLRWRALADKAGIKYKQVNIVHDEFQTVVNSGEDDARLLGQLQVQAIREMTEKFNLVCPMDGEYRIGKNWFDTH